MIEESDALKDCMTIGQGVTLVGSVFAKGQTVINGQFSGVLATDELIIGQFGSATGKFDAREIMVNGSLNQEVNCQGLTTINATGTVSGQLNYGELQIARGGTITGVLEQHFVPANPVIGMLPT